MEFKLKPLSIYELGQRTNQEDAIYPGIGEADDKSRLFILCDGMGGHDAGEVASRTVCEALSEEILSTVASGGEFTDEQFNTALAEAYDALDEKDNGTVKKMGTTMTFLKFHREGCTVAHIGDSRIYHIRPSEKKILFQTRDHSLVNDLIKIGELTPEEAKTSKQKNVITRAMQPLLERRPKADIHHITDIRKGDYFFMCSDGMLEEMENKNLIYILSRKETDEKKVEMLKKVTKNNHDNHSAHLIHVLDVAPDAKLPPEQNSGVKKQTNKSYASPKTNMILLLIVIVACLFLFMFFRGYLKKKGIVRVDKGINKMIVYNSGNNALLIV